MVQMLTPEETTQQAEPDLLVDIPPDEPTDKPMFTLGFFFQWGVIFVLLVVSLILGMLVSKSTSQLPDIHVLQNYRPYESTQIFDRNGSLIANIHGDEDRVVVPIKQISPYLPRAIMAIEDNRFYEHNGIDPRGTARAFFTDVGAEGHVQGGSTLTQQLVKNLFLTPEKSYARKLAEAVLALRVERYYSKDQILEMYLNQVYYGNQSYGAEKAARRYFKVSAKRLSLGQAALLAGLLKAPEGLSPYSYPKASKKRQLEVLNAMVTFGYITKKQRDAAAMETITLNSRKPKPSKYPYYVGYVIQELESRYGEDVVRRGGLKVYTTLDPVSQEAAERAVFENVQKLKGNGVKQGALVALDAQTGELLSMVGGIDFEKNQFNAATMARRAVGSTFKPFVYLTAFRLNKITTKTPISDRPISYGGWSPHNWDGKYMGAMDIRKALTLSRNTPTVQVGMKIGIEEVAKTCQLAGIRSPIDLNSSSLLGSSGVSLLELTTAYSTFSRGGIYIEPTAIKRVEDSRGKLVKIDTPAPRRVFDQDYVAELVDILIDVVEKGTATSAKFPDRVAAGKTGTTDNMRDVWFMGFTPDIVAGVWMGDPKNVPMHGVYGANSAKVWKEFADAYYLAHPTPPQQFFVASSDFAAKTGIIHLVDSEGLAAAKKRNAVEKLGSEEDFNEKKENKPTKNESAPKQETVRQETPAEPYTPVSQPAAPNAAPPTTNPANPALNETSGQKQEKFHNWKDSLDNIKNNNSDN